MKKLLLLFVLVLPFTQSCDFFQKKDMFSNDEDSLLVYQKMQDSLKFIDSIKTLKNELSILKSKHRRLMDSIKTKAPRQRTDYKYHIIVGSFKNPEFSNSYNKYVQDKGFQTRILENEYGFKMVAIESSNSWSQAVNTVKELREEFEESAWIYVEK